MTKIVCPENRIFFFPTSFAESYTIEDGGLYSVLKGRNFLFSIYFLLFIFVFILLTLLSMLIDFCLRFRSFLPKVIIQQIS